MSALASHILAAVAPSRFGGTLAAGDWPSSARYAVSVSVHDRQFPSVEHSDVVEFFDSISEFLAWRARKLAWIRGTDYDFSMSYSFYEWDWGPVFRFCR